MNNEELVKKIEEQDKVISNLINRVKTAEKNTEEAIKEAKKVKKDLHGLRDAHNNRVKEFIGNKGSIEAIAKHMQGQLQIVNGLRYAMSTILEKGLITQDEITAFTTNLMEQAEKQAEGKTDEAADKQTDSNEAEKPSEGGSVQP